MSGALRLPLAPGGMPLLLAAGVRLRSRGGVRLLVRLPVAGVRSGIILAGGW